MSKLFKLALEEYTPEEIIDDTSLDEISNPDTAADMSDIETATEEINECKEEIYKYVVAMEEASNTVDAIYSQIDRNNQLIAQGDVSTVDVTIATEAIHNIADNIGWDGLNGINLSTEGYGSNIDKLKIANEAGEGMISSIIKAIKDFFIKIINMVKKLYIKFMSWINLYDKKLQGLKKDFHNVLYSGNAMIDPKLILKLVELFPFLSSKDLQDTTLKDLVKDRFQVAKWVEHLNPKNLDATIDDVVSGKFGSKMLNIPYLDYIYIWLSNVIEKQGDKERIALITSFRGGNVNYISATRDQEGKFKLGEIKTEVYNVQDDKSTYNVTDWSISTNDFSELVDYTSKNLTSGLKDFNNNILKLQEKCKEKLDKMTGADATDEIKANLKTIQYLGGRVSVDMCLSIFDVIRRYIKAMVTIHSECVTMIPNYNLMIECLNIEGNFGAEIRYMKNNKAWPYIYSEKLFDRMAGLFGNAKTIPLAGFCPVVKGVDITKKLAENKGERPDDLGRAQIRYMDKCKELGVDPYTIEQIIHLNTDCEVLSPVFAYFHEMGHACLNQSANIPEEVFDEYFKGLDEGENERTALQAAQAYTENPIEVQADAYACLMTGGSYKTTWDRRYRLKFPNILITLGYRDWWKRAGVTGNALKKKEEEYKKLFEKQTAIVRPWANAGCLARLKSWIKGNR